MDMNSASYRIIADLLEARTGQQLTEARKWRIGTALIGVLRKHRIANTDQLVGMLAQPATAPLAREVVDALLNNETYFFRDRPVFDALARDILPGLAQKRQAQRRLSIWSAGCSTGQEALSLAMLFQRNAAAWRGWTIEILGTDVSTTAVEKAQAGLYSQFEIQRGLGMTEMLLYFDETLGSWQPKPELRRMMRFKQRNLLAPPPTLQRFDLVLCRNVLLYFDDTKRALALDRVADALRPDGWLMLGSGETVNNRSERFTPTADRLGLFHVTAADKRSEKLAIGSGLTVVSAFDLRIVQRLRQTHCAAVGQPLD